MPKTGANFFKEGPLQENDHVIVRIWLSTVDDQPTNAKAAVIAGRTAAKTSGKKGSDDANVGHVSLQTVNHYISLWPGAAPNSLNRVVKGKLNQLADDIAGEGRQPHHTIYLYSLNNKAIEAAFDDIREEGTKWVLTGDSSFTDGDKGHSCVSLVYALLQRGGLDKLLDSIDSSSHASTHPAMASGLISPNEFADHIHKAKHDELEHYAETKQFHQDEQSDLEPDSQCQIM